MPRFAANLTLLYNEFPFLERVAAAAADSFEGVECLFPYEAPADALAAALRASGIELVLFNLPPGNWAAGERGMASHPGREAEFAAGLEQALAYARATGCRRLHAMAGLRLPGVPATEQQAVYVANLRRAARRVAAEGITLLIEPLNTRDMPGYWLTTQQQAHDTVAEVGEANLRVQMDLYHCQIMEGDLAARLRRHLDGVGHLQIAGVPGRHEPDVGEIHHPYLFALLDELGYGGWVGCEYRPAAGTRAGLGWLQRERMRALAATA